MNDVEFIAERVGFKRTNSPWIWLYPDGTKEGFIQHFPTSLDAQEKWVWRDDWEIEFTGEGCIIYCDYTRLCWHIGKGKTRAEQAWACIKQIHGWGVGKVESIDGEQNHKGQPCISTNPVHPATCQEGYCSECAVEKQCPY